MFELLNDVVKPVTFERSAGPGGDVRTIHTYIYVRTIHTYIYVRTIHIYIHIPEDCTARYC